MPSARVRAGSSSASATPSSASTRDLSLREELLRQQDADATATKSKAAAVAVARALSSARPVTRYTMLKVGALALGIILALLSVLIAASRELRGRHLAPALTPETLPPTFLFSTIIGAVSLLESLTVAITPPNVYLFKQLMGYLHTAEIKTAAELRLADHLWAHEKKALALEAERRGRMTAIERLREDLARILPSVPLFSGARPGSSAWEEAQASVSMTAEELAVIAIPECQSRAQGLPFEATCSRVALRLARLLRSLASYGLFTETAPGRFANTQSSLFLIDDHPFTLRAAALNFGGTQFKMVEKLSTTIKTGEAAFSMHPEHNKLSFWDFYVQHPEEHKVFDRTMVELGTMGGQDAAIAKDVDWPKALAGGGGGGGGGASTSFLVDVGGGYGRLLKQILRESSSSSPSIKGIVFDLPSTVEEADKQGLVSSDVEFAAGDMFSHTTVPSLGSLEVTKSMHAAVVEALVLAGRKEDDQELEAVKVCSHSGLVIDGNGDGNGNGEASTITPQIVLDALKERQKKQREEGKGNSKSNSNSSFLFYSETAIATGPAEEKEGVSYQWPRMGYLLRDILHDWTDDDSAKILSSLSTVMANRFGLSLNREPLPIDDGKESATPGSISGAPLLATCFSTLKPQPTEAGEANISNSSSSSSAAWQVNLSSYPIFSSETKGKSRSQEELDAMVGRLGKDRVFVVGRVLKPHSYYGKVAIPSSPSSSPSSSWTASAFPSSSSSFVDSWGSFDADVLMMSAFGGTAGERSLQHYSSLLCRAGLRIVKVHKLRGQYSVIEAKLATTITVNGAGGGGVGGGVGKRAVALVIPREDKEAMRAVIAEHGPIVTC